MYEDPNKKTNKYEALLKDINDKAYQLRELIRKLVMKELIVPFCDKYRISFWSGMGGYGFKTRSGEDFTDWFVRDCKSGRGNFVVCDVVSVYKKTSAAKETISEILPVLNLIEQPGERCSLGCYLEDYTPTKKVANV